VSIERLEARSPGEPSTLGGLMANNAEDHSPDLMDVASRSGGVDTSNRLNFRGALINSWLGLGNATVRYKGTCVEGDES
jgi:hypothetical protein